MCQRSGNICVLILPLVFFLCIFAVIKAENCALPAKLMLKEIGVRWNLLTDGEKAVWSERAAEDKIRFARDVRCYAIAFFPSHYYFILRFFVLIHVFYVF